MSAIPRSPEGPGGSKGGSSAELLRAYREEGDVAARDRVVERFMPMVRASARRHADGREELEDLIQVGTLGLLRAIERFDPGRGADLAPFAAPTIDGEIKRHLRDRGGLVRGPRGGVRDGVVTTASLAGDNPLEPATAESLAPEDRVALIDGIRALTERQREALYLRYVYGLSHAEAAERLATSERQLSRTLRAAMRALREELAGRGGPPTDVAMEEPSDQRAAQPVERKQVGRKALCEKAAGLTIGSMAPREQAVATERYLNLPYHIELARADGDGEDTAWTAQVEELPGCEARGSTPDEAARRVRTEMERWISAAISARREVPEPRTAADYSGKLLLRMPQTLHAELARLADRDKVSLNQFITGVLSSAVGWRASRAPLAENDSASDTSAAPRERRSPRLGRVLIVNVVLLVVAATVAIALLVIALENGL